MKFARPQTSGTRYFKQLNFFGNTKTHICIHVWTKICCKECASGRSERRVSKRQRSCWFIPVSWPTERKSSPFPNVYLTLQWHLPLSTCGTAYLRYRGSISLKTPHFDYEKTAFPDDQAALQRCLFLDSMLFFQPSNSRFVPLGVSRWVLTPWPLTLRRTVDCYSSAYELLHLKTHIYWLWPKSYKMSAAAWVCPKQHDVTDTWC